MEATTTANTAIAVTTDSARVVKTVDAKRILDIFSSSLDVTKAYSLDELKKLVTQSYKDAAKKKKGGSKENAVKRAPTKYNIFVKDEMAKLREEYPDKEFKELMKMAAEKWNENKGDKEGKAEKLDKVPDDTKE
jgi:hypothetical protein